MANLTATDRLALKYGVKDFTLAEKLADKADAVEPSAYGSIYLSTVAETTIATVSSGGITGDNYVKCAGTTTAISLKDFDMPASNRLRYTGTANRHLHIAISFSQTVAANNKVLGFKLAVNGTAQDGSYLPRKQGTGTDVGSTAMHWDVMVSTNDYIELFVANETDSTNMTLEALYMFALAMAP